ncbi:hypothetical protein [Legionella brunensis]|uniref:Transmembrane protein n=1 Tax=Legionella brunensis TaxID=29422 RepID=A0A0W0SM50_9GAMM|nr:hypothetical protein [Legionella brunensis]KTC84482.1 transmembrane protein [Legionella brunensis]
MKKRKGRGSQKNPVGTNQSAMPTKKTEAATNNSLNPPVIPQHVKVAKKIHELGYIYALYGLLDAEVVAYGSIRYFFDVLFVNQSSGKLIHDWLQTPSGLAIALVESIAFASFSMIANTSDNKATGAFKQAAASFWPYCRNAVRELKKTSRGVGNTLKIATFFKEVSLDSMVMPLGLTFGAASVLNRVWFQRMDNRRREMKEGLKTLYEEISELKFDSSMRSKLQQDRINLQGYYEKIQYQSQTEQKFAYLSAAYTGLMEGLAFYVGILTFISFTSPAFIPMATCCIAFAIISIATRIYEEYEYQRKFTVDSLIIKLRLKQKDIEALNALTAGQIVGDSNEQYERIFKEIIEISNALDAKAVSTLNKVLKSMKEGLKIYAFINKMIFGATVFLTTLPAYLIIGSVVTGVLILLGMTLKAIIKQHCLLKKEANGQLLFTDEGQLAASQLVEKLIQTHTAVSTTKPSSFRAWFEVTWNFFSGLDKGRKSMGYLLMLTFAELSLHENYQDSPLMIKLSVGLGILSSLIFSLRVYAFNFGANLQKEPIQLNKHSNEYQFEEIPTGNVPPQIIV